jgi:hypothetical protein
MWPHTAVIRVCDEAGDVIEKHDHVAICMSGESQSRCDCVKAKSRYAVKHDGSKLLPVG